MTEIPKEINSDSKLEKIEKDTPSGFINGSVSVSGEQQITPEELIARNPHLYGKPSVCRKF